MRLLAIHNLAYLEGLMRGAREAIAAGRFDDTGGGRWAVSRPRGSSPSERDLTTHCVWALMKSLSWFIWSGIVS